MKKTKMVLAVTITFLFLTSGPVAAVKPGSSVNPNGFPSGAHYNLNLLGKKVGFNCPEQDDYELSNRNVIYVPDSGKGIKIYIQSGQGKKFEDIDQLQVTDWCAFDTNGATFQLPKNDAGYGVYIRVLAKHNNDPENDPYIANIMAQLSMAQDENGNQLIYLGEVEDGRIKTYDGQIFRHKGKSKAVEITDLFMFAGTVCSIVECAGLDTDRHLCCYGEDANGFYEHCLEYDGTGCEGEGVPVCGQCQSYAENPIWIFNLSDFVELLWQFDNSGVKNTQIRFYPR